METKIQPIRFDITDKLTAFIEGKVEKLARRYPDITSADVALKVVKPETAMNKDAVIDLKAPRLGEDFVAHKVADSFEEAVVLCLEAIERQLEKKKEK